jgi:predicted small secreted protein
VKTKSLHSSLMLCLLVLAASFSTTSCNSQNLGVGLSIGIIPGQTVIVPVGNVSSCVDYYTLLQSQLSGSTSATLGQSISAPSFTFTDFNLNWTSTDEKLYIKAIRVVVQGTGIQGGKISTYMPTNEIIDLLLAPKVGQTAIPILYDGVNGEFDNPVDIDSNGTLKTTPIGTAPNQATPLSVACGFTIGGINLTAGDQTPSFIAQIEIEVIGVAIKTTDQTQRVVIQTTTATAQYIGIDQ